jgi:site-specific recombinase XerD
MMTRRLCDVGIGEKKTIATMMNGKPKTRTVYRSPYSPHSLRVAVITDLLDQGEDIHDVAFLVGHSSTRTTQGYNRNKMEVKRNLVERIRVHLPKSGAEE